MSDLIFKENKQDYELPSLKEKGYIIVKITGKVEEGYYKDDWIIENYSYDGSAFWINEGMGVDYFINSFVCDDIPDIGFWTIEGITGSFTKGDGWEIDDEEDWEWETIRLATEKEKEKLK